MRYFKIRNANGETYDLTVKDREFLFAVSGLGYKDDVEYRRVASIYKRLSDYKDQMAIDGTIHFFNKAKPQQRYFDLINFLQVKPLTLIYEPKDLGRTFYRTGTVTEVDFDENNPLQVDITFTCTTLWYERKDVITRPNSETEITGKIYDYTYSYVYRNSQTNTVTLLVDSMQESPVKLFLYGELVNPEWIHYVNGKEVSSGKVNYTIPNGYVLVIDTTDVPFSIKEYDSAGNFVADLYSYSDFGTKRFIMLENGENRLSVTDDVGNKVVVKAEAMVNYASV